jgi:hypothetical protein
MDFVEILFFLAIAGSVIFRFVNRKNKQKAAEEEQANTEATLEKKKSKIEMLLESLEMLDQDEAKETLGQPGMSQRMQQQGGQGTQAPRQQPYHRPQPQGEMQALAQSQQQKIEQETKAKEAYQRQKEQERLAYLKKQQLEKDREKALKNQEIGGQRVASVGGLGLNNQKQLVRGIIISEILGPPQALKKR